MAKKRRRVKRRRANAYGITKAAGDMVKIGAGVAVLGMGLSALEGLKK